MPDQLRKKIAQLICIGFSGTDLNTAEQLQAWLRHPDGLGAVILFDYDLPRNVYGKNIKSIEQLRQLNLDIKTLYQQHHLDAPPIWISIDVEGGRVDRLAQLKGYSILPSAKNFSTFDEKKRQELWTQHAKFLKFLGIDLNFAPVVDLELSKQFGVLGPLGRCFSDNPTWVTSLAAQYLTILNREGILGCLKHFPGHGSAILDTHLELVDVTTSYQASELQPYLDLIVRTDLNFAVMSAHVINKKLDESGLPATLSRKILHDLLRQELHFSGLVISDDLQMSAVAKHYSRQEILLKTLLAGADILIFGNQLSWDEPQHIIDEIQDLVSQGVLAEQVIDQAYQRILQYKLKS